MQGYKEWVKRILCEEKGRLGKVSGREGPGVSKAKTGLGQTESHPTPARRRPTVVLITELSKVATML
jgi:hypothetical protein